MAALPPQTMAHCNVCGGERNHAVLHEAAETWLDAEFGQYERTETYETLQCAGCNKIKFRHRTRYPGDSVASTTYFPAAVFRPRPSWLVHLDYDQQAVQDGVIDLLEEVYSSLHQDLVRVAAMGVRALLERVMIAKVGDLGSFAANLTAFQQSGFVSGLQKQRLDAVLEAGHAAIHRGYTPSRTDVIALVDIAEHIIESIYAHETKVERLRSRTPPRRPKR